MIKSDKKLVIIDIYSDIILLNISVILSLLVRYRENFEFSNFSNQDLNVFYLFNLAWLISLLYIGFNRKTLQSKKFFTKTLTYLKRTITYTVLISILFYITKFQHPRSAVYSALIFYFILKIIFEYFFYLLITVQRFRGKNLTNIILVGSTQVTKRLDKYIANNRELGYNILSIVSSRQKKYSIEKIKKIIEKNRVNEIFIDHENNRSKINDYIDLADFHGIRVRLIPNFNNLLKESINIGYIGNTPLLNIRYSPLDDLVNLFIKRLFDIIFSLVAIIITFPISLFVFIYLFFFSKGPVLYKPVRLGKSNKEFVLYKFRSMVHNDSPNQNFKSTQENDPRITSFGKIIRKLSIDEFPQFLNVLRGDMSVVGPRPHRIHLNNILQLKVKNYMVRHYVKPGITGWAQVNGWRGPTVTKEQREQRTFHDLWYLENWTFFLDIKIIFMTIFGNKTNKNVF